MQNTPTLGELEALADRVAALEGPCREVDALSWCHVNGIVPEWQGNCLVASTEGVIGYIDPGKHQRNFSTNGATHGPGSIPAYTASIDAAMSLVPEGWFTMLALEDRHSHSWRWSLRGGYGFEMTARAARPALALTAAALRASAAPVIGGGE